MIDRQVGRGFRPKLESFVIGIIAWAGAGAAMGATAAPAADVERLIDDFLYGSLALEPVMATTVGYHSHRGRSLDAAIDDYSASGIAAQRRFMRGIERRVTALDTKALDREQLADVDILRGAVGAVLLELDEIQSYRHKPTAYVELVGNALYTPYVLHYASAQIRFAHIVSRLRRIPALVDEAKANLVDSPEIWNRVAREENAGNIDLIDTILRGDCPQALRADYDRAAAPAIAALRDFNGWLEAVLSRHAADWRLGKPLYAKKFRLTLATGTTPEELLAAAEADLVKTRADMADIAAPRSVEAALEDVAGRHATRADYVAAAREAVADANAFLREKDLLTLPARGNLQVVETPVFMRGIYAVAGFNAAPALQPGLGAFYYITPIPADWTAERAESKLREYNLAGLRHVAVHEAMPGHYVQLEYANDVEPKSRRLLRTIYGNGAYVEGWGMYGQQMMAEQGYHAEDPGFRLTLGKQKLRIIANAILDVRLQTLGMTDQEALDLMMKGAYQEREEAGGKLQRAKLDSCQLPTYYAGLNGWLAIREHERARRGASFTLKDFHERALRESAVPLPVLDRLLQ